LRNKKCNLDCGHELRICPRPENNHGKPWPCWLVAPSSDFQPGVLVFRYTNPNRSYSMCSCSDCKTQSYMLYRNFSCFFVWVTNFLINPYVFMYLVKHVSLSSCIMYSVSTPQRIQERGYKCCY
jgi:hypothetical protein